MIAINSDNVVFWGLWRSKARIFGTAYLRLNECKAIERERLFFRQWGSTPCGRTNYFSIL